MGNLVSTNYEGDQALTENAEKTREEAYQRMLSNQKKTAEATKSAPAMKIVNSHMKQLEDSLKYGE